MRDIISLPSYLFRNPKHFLDLCFFKITPIIAAYSVPPLVLFSVWILRSPESISIFGADETLLFLSLLCTGTLFVFVLTSLKPFLFLGQAERYFEYSAGFIYSLFVYYIWKMNMNTKVVFWVFCFQITAILINFMYSQLSTIKGKLTIFESRTFQSLIDYLKGRRDLRLLSIPTKANFGIATALNSIGGMFYYDNISRHDKIDGIKYMEDDHLTLGFVRTDMQYFAKKYGINTVVAEKNALKAAEELSIFYHFRNDDKLFENEDYLVYKVDLAH